MKTSIDVAGQTLSATLRRLPDGYSATTLIVVAGARRSVMGKGASPDRALVDLIANVGAARQGAAARLDAPQVGLRR
jgi:hypothetical protein